MRYKLCISYDGTPFCGWQRQKSGPSIQQTIEEALAICLKKEITLFGSGRTDAGVHAYTQVAHFDFDDELNLYKLRESLNALVRPHPISIKSVEIVPDDFHARFSAKKRTYIYKIFNAPYPPALDSTRVWWYRHPLDVDKMQNAAQILVGKHDFSTFRASECQAKSPIKTIDSITFEQQNEYVIMSITAKSFLHHQVRNIIGSLVLVGANKWSQNDLKKALETKDRKAGGPTAPASGLYFYHIEY